MRKKETEGVRQKDRSQQWRKGEQAKEQTKTKKY